MFAHSFLQLGMKRTTRDPDNANGGVLLFYISEKTVIYRQAVKIDQYYLASVFADGFFQIGKGVESSGFIVLSFKQSAEFQALIFV
jgi:hypothetical protein